jgi:hypothetical protein
MIDKWVSEWQSYRGPVIVIQPDQSVVLGQMVNAEPHRPFCVIRFNPRAPLGRVHPKWVRPDEWAMMTRGEP